MHKNEQYIAYTRALSDLIIVVDENIDKLIELNKNTVKKVKRKTSASGIKTAGSVKVGNVKKKKTATA